MALVNDILDFSKIESGRLPLEKNSLDLQELLLQTRVRVVGLAISYGLVALMGGELRVTSEVGRGSRFWFSLDPPLSQSSDRHRTTGIADAQRNSTEVRGTGVLVAEDNAVNQLLVKKMLLRLGCEVTIVPNGAEAVQAWTAREFDVILMDCQMPEMDGVEATQRIRRSSVRGSVRGATVPIIALTAGALQTDREQAMLAGMSDFLTKPLLALALEAALHRALFNVERIRSSPVGARMPRPLRRITKHHSKLAALDILALHRFAEGRKLTCLILSCCAAMPSRWPLNWPGAASYWTLPRWRRSKSSAKPRK